MARPKLGDSDTERLHLKITADELKEIDDWRYENRVPSRSESVRRLVQIGLAFDALSDTLEAEAIEVVKAATKALKEHLGPNPPGKDDIDRWVQSWSRSTANLYKLVQKQTSLSAKIGAVSEPTRQLRQHESFDAAMKNAQEALDAMRKQIDAAKLEDLE